MRLRPETPPPQGTYPWEKTDSSELHGACHAARAGSDLSGVTAMFAKTLDADPAYEF